MKYFFLLFIFINVLFSKETIMVYTYNNYAPFIISSNKGLSITLVNFLNKNSDDFSFKLQYLPRKRLNYFLKDWIDGKCQKEIFSQCEKKWMVIWGNEQWGFEPNKRKNFYWQNILKDANVVLSEKSNIVEYKSVKDLFNKSFAGVYGYKYIHVDEYVSKGLITRIDSKKEVNNLYVLKNKRVDVAILPRSVFEYYKKIDKSLNSLYAAKHYHQEYIRKLFTPFYNTQLIKYLKTLDLMSLYK